MYSVYIYSTYIYTEYAPSLSMICDDTPVFPLFSRDGPQSPRARRAVRGTARRAVRGTARRAVRGTARPGPSVSREVKMCL